MKQRHFIKFDPKIKRFTGCDRATLILEKIEYFFSNQPEGFYKFIEPCSHRLYKKDDSWSEELGCDRKCFTRSWEKIGFRHKSRRAFEEAEDKFEGKLYASYYDRNLNQMFFVRNHDLANETLKEFYEPKKQKAISEGYQAKKSTDSLILKPLGTGHNVRSYITKKTSIDLSKDKSHANNEIIKKMVDIWIAIVGEGGGQIELKGKIVPFLKKALTDKFNNCLQKWKEYCISVARSKFLMGEKTSWKADLEWAIKFESIRKILSGNYYGIGDRNRKLTHEELQEMEKELEEQQKAREIEHQRTIHALEEEIKNSSNEPDFVKNFRIKWLRSFGVQNYKEILADCIIKIGEKETDLIIQPEERMIARRLKSDWNTQILSDQPFKRVQIYHCIDDLMGKPHIFDHWIGDVEEDHVNEQESGKDTIPGRDFDESIDENQTTETKYLRDKLKDIIPTNQFPSWLDGIEAQEIKEDGTLVATFKDQFTANYAQARFYKEILQAATELWQLDKLIIQEKYQPLKNNSNLELKEYDEESLPLRAIKSLIKLNITNSVGLKLNDEIPI